MDKRRLHPCTTRVDFDALGATVSEDDGFVLTVGLRAAITRMVEINAGVS